MKFWFCLVLVFLGFSFANSSADLVQNSLSQIKTYVVYIIGVIISINLLPLAWDKISPILFRDSKSSLKKSDSPFTSNKKSRVEARARLSKSKNRSSRYISDGNSRSKPYSASRKASNFRRKFSTYEDFEGSIDSTLRKGRKTIFNN